MTKFRIRADSFVFIEEIYLQYEYGGINISRRLDGSANIDFSMDTYLASENYESVEKYYEECCRKDGNHKTKILKDII